MARPACGSASTSRGHAAAAGLALVAGSLAAAPARADAGRAAITAALEASAAAWSRNDVAAFMRAYEDSPATTYLGNGTVVRGYGAIRAMYAQRLGHGSAGRLSLDVLEVRALGPDYALCIGRFALALPARPAAGGMFTLVFHRAQGAWRIVSDHTSS